MTASVTASVKKASAAKTRVNVANRNEYMRTSAVSRAAGGPARRRAQTATTRIVTRAAIAPGSLAAKIVVPNSL